MVFCPTLDKSWSSGSSINTLLVCVCREAQPQRYWSSRLLQTAGGNRVDISWLLRTAAEAICSSTV
jgi:hypothetical protein